MSDPGPAGEVRAVRLPAHHRVAAAQKQSAPVWFVCFLSHEYLLATLILFGHSAEGESQNKVSHPAVRA